MSIEKQAQQKGILLYVEDTMANLRFMQAVMEQYVKFDMLSAVTGKEGINLAREHQPDVILLDINLPDIDGYEVFSLLQENAETRDIPVIALSAAAMQHDIERGLAAGFLHYLTKPVDILELINVLDSVVISNRDKPVKRSD